MNNAQANQTGTHAANPSTSRPASTAAAPPLTVQEGIDAANAARLELHKTIGQLSYKLDYPSRFDAALKAGRERITQTRRTNPLSFAAGVAAVSLAAGAIVALVGRAIVRKL